MKQRWPMRIILSLIVPVWVTLICVPPAAATSCPVAKSNQALDTTQPLNLGQLKMQLLDYVCFGDYEKAVAATLDTARAFVEMRAPQVSRPAIVLDIDETSLSNWPQILANDFG